jgi:hypothetical protein
MGRVGRYKKVKACDPFAKQRPGKKPRREFDLPPDEDQTGPLKTGKALRRQERRWAREAMGDFGDDALGEGALADVSSAPPPPRVAIDPRRANESQKAFERRLKDDSAKLLTGQDKGDSTSLRRECSARARSGKSIHASRPFREMIARPKISRNEWKPAELGAFEVGNFALLSCPGY